MPDGFHKLGGEGGLNDGDLAHIAETTAVRAMTDTLGRMGKHMQEMTVQLIEQNKTMGEMRLDLERLKIRSEQDERRDEEIKVLKGKVETIELLHAQQVGAGKLITGLKEFGPWLFGMVAAALAYLGGSHKL